MSKLQTPQMEQIIIIRLVFYRAGLEMMMIHSSNRELLSIVLGDEATSLATRSLAELFGLRALRHSTTLGAEQEVHIYAVPDRLLAARELLRRALEEELSESAIGMTSPAAVRDYLRLFLGGQEYESFVTLWLDGQNRLIAMRSTRVERRASAA